MAVLKSRLSLLVFALTVGCGPIDRLLFNDLDPPVPPGSGGNGAVAGAGGLSPEPSYGGQGGAALAPQGELLVDDFNDGDTRAEGLSQWWYIANDGTGTQSMSIISAADGPISEDTTGNILAVSVEGFSDWGALFGLDIGQNQFSPDGLELRFRIASATETDISFAVIDKHDTFFIESVHVTPEWSSTVIRLDQILTVVGGEATRMDPLLADELQWFISGGTPNTIWLDDVTLTLL